MEFGMDWAKEQLNNYPERVKLGTRLFTGSGQCNYSGYMARIQIGFWKGTFEHEMGHATAYLMGINEELGKMVMAEPGAKIETNDNPFCYAAQRLARGEYDTAIAEYSADAIKHYYRGEYVFSPMIREYLDSKLK